MYVRKFKIGTEIITKFSKFFQEKYFYSDLPHFYIHISKILAYISRYFCVNTNILILVISKYLFFLLFVLYRNSEIIERENALIDA